MSHVKKTRESHSPCLSYSDLTISTIKQIWLSWASCKVRVRVKERRVALRLLTTVQLSSLKMMLHFEHCNSYSSQNVACCFKQMVLDVAMET